MCVGCVCVWGVDGCEALTVRVSSSPTFIGKYSVALSEGSNNLFETDAPERPSGTSCRQESMAPGFPCAVLDQESRRPSDRN